MLQAENRTYGLAPYGKKHRRGWSEEGAREGEGGERSFWICSFGRFLAFFPTTFTFGGLRKMAVSRLFRG